jgi:hypothetical protein
MKKFLPVLIGSGILLLSFQNCSQNSELFANGNSTSPPQTKIEDPVLSQAQSLDILTQNDQRVSLNLKTGELVQDSNGNLVKKCLPDSIRAEISDILANSNLCEPEDRSDVMCAQIYAAPYSEIHWADKSIKVGEIFSSCHKDVDLCGNDGKLLRGILKDVVARWNEWSCDFKVVSN